MSRRGFSNTANELSLVGTLDTLTTSVTITVSPAPSGWPSTPCFAVIDPNTASEEVVLVTAISGTSVTITRGGSLATTYGSTTRPHSTNAKIQHAATAADFDEANAHVNATTGDPHPQYLLPAEADAAYVAKTLVDAKGDLLVATADNTLARLPVGADNLPLVADSTQASGMKWAYPQAMTCTIYRDGDAIQSIPNNSETAIIYDTVLNAHDPFSMAFLPGNSIVCPIDGLYRITVHASFQANSSGYREVLLYRNNSLLISEHMAPPVGADTEFSFSIDYHGSVNDAFHVHYFQNSGGALNTGNRINTMLQVTLIGTY